MSILTLLSCNPDKLLLSPLPSSVLLHSCHHNIDCCTNINTCSNQQLHRYLNIDTIVHAFLPVCILTNSLHYTLVSCMVEVTPLTGYILWCCCGRHLEAVIIKLVLYICLFVTFMKMTTDHTIHIFPSIKQRYLVLSTHIQILNINI